MSEEIRRDRSELAAPLNAKVFEGRVARIHSEGDPLRYSWGDEYRDEAELRNIVEQLPGTPFTLQHPSGLISDGTPARIIGRVIAARVDGDYAVATILVTDDEGLEAIESGVQELSLGYTAHKDEKHFQRDIKVDHLAVVVRGRCGSCSLRADSDCGCPSKADGQLKVEVVPDQVCGCGAVATTVPTANLQGTDTVMADSNADHKPLLDELQKKLADALAEAAAQKARADQAEEKAIKAEADKVAAEVIATNAQASIAAEKARADAAEAAAKAAEQKSHADAADAFGKRVDERVELLTAAGAVGLKDAEGKALELKTMTDRAIKVAVIKHIDGLEVTDDKVDAYVDGVFAGALDRHAKATESRNDAREAIAAVRKDAAAVIPMNWRDAEKAAQSEMVKTFSK